MHLTEQTHRRAVSVGRQQINMVKASSLINQNGFKKGAWSEDEDEKLRAYITRYGHWNWGLLPKFAGLSRSGKSCRLRWMNYLRPDMKHGNFTIEEDNIIVDLHSKLGNKWSAIAAKLPGRSDNEIKNRWNVHLKKRAQLDQTEQKTETTGTMNSINQVNPKENQDQEVIPSESENLSARVLCDQSPSSSSCSELTSYWLRGSDYGVSNDNISADHQSLEKGHIDDDDFWAEPFLPDITDTQVNSMSPISLDIIDHDFMISGYSSCQDMMMTDEFTWSMLDSHFEYNSQFMS